MAKIPAITSIPIESFPKDVQPWIGKLLNPLNQFLNAAVLALSANLTFSDNLLGQQNTLTFTYGANTLPQSFSISMNATPQDLRVVSATENNVPCAIIAAWSATSKSVQLTDLTKVSKGVTSQLVSGATYNIVVRIVP